MAALGALGLNGERRWIRLTWYRNGTTGAEGVDGLVVVLVSRSTSVMDRIRIAMLFG
ncbi:hypothetical protein ACCAA_650006 [Candidatus Accumulibacter aalborgensis]|uniref:Uncharacterized protein n=1 Tax=Candidatus Accumulibacter aalborgensis TaxID=1860102 RepID=A0A1A8XV08_9PROT|nr:hypothetical protein ACCAA_650006 [Candidatus Accumulibacter aalborgensis]